MGKGRKAPYDGIVGLFERFPDEAACLRHIVDIKWGAHTPCPHCARFGKWAQIGGTKKWRHSCRKQFSPLQGTVFYRSNLSLMAWFYGLFLFSHASAGVRSSFVRKQLGLGHNSAVRLCRMIRVQMAGMPRPATLGGPGKTVHIDEVYLRYLAYNTEGQNSAALVLGLACEGKVICGIVPDRRTETLLPAILSRVEPGSTLVTDMHSAYRDLASHGFRHIQINHSVAFHDFKGNTNNPIEVYWSTVRRCLRSYRQVSAENLWTYLAEIEFRYNRRSTPHTAFADLISNFPLYNSDTEAEWRARFQWAQDDHASAVEQSRGDLPDSCGIEIDTSRTGNG